MVYLNQAFTLADISEDTDMIVPVDGTRIGSELLKLLKLDLEKPFHTSTLPAILQDTLMQSVYESGGMDLGQLA